MRTSVFALALTLGFVVPQIPLALGNESGPTARAGSPAFEIWKEPPLPAVPSVDWMPWWAPGSSWSEPELDSTWRPDLKPIPPFKLQPTAPKDQVSKAGQKSVVRTSSSS